MGRKVIVIVGATCSGKTVLGLKLAELLNSEIISADSRQIYKYLDIGTAKPSIEELSKIKHHFIDYLGPEEEYNVSRYEKEALIVIDSLTKLNKTPIIVGGSGLYIRSVVDGIFDNVETDEILRLRLKKTIEDYGPEQLLEQLKNVDPESAAKMLPQNWKRIMRALEVFYLTGKTITEWQKEYKRNIDLEFEIYGLCWNREILYKMIEKRVDNMIKFGLVDEVQKLLKKGYSKELNSLNTVGYKEIFDYLDNTILLDRAVELIKRNTRHYAKRQLTWFNADKRINWVKVTGIKDIERLAEKIAGSKN
ncbi:MAG: tRNA (adenosine(37)-N6)-dimethylallyltransferase MiaA [bacterium]